MDRYEDWQTRLSIFLEENHHRNFKRGSFDCAIFAGLALQVIAGENFVDDYIGKFKTKREAFKLLRSEGIDDLLQVADKYLGDSLSHVNLGMRGDVVAIEFDGDYALGVIDMTGRRAVTTGKDGLIFLGVKHWLKAWRV